MLLCRPIPMNLRHVYPSKKRFTHDGSKIQCKKCAHHMGQKSFREPSGVVFLGYMVYLLLKLHKPWVTSLYFNGYGYKNTERAASLY